MMTTYNATLKLRIVVVFLASNNMRMGIIWTIIIIPPNSHIRTPKLLCDLFFEMSIPST